MIIDTMGLDMYVNRKLKLASGRFYDDGDEKINEYDDMYWRNSYSTANWVENNLIACNENKTNFILSFDKIEELIGKLESVLKYEYLEDKSECSILFPSYNGKYDDFYFSEVKQTLKYMKVCLGNKFDPDLSYVFVISR